MYPELDDPEVIRRMRTAFRRACTALTCQPAPQATETWGWRGRTLSLPVLTPDGPAWLRVGCAQRGGISPTLWNGSITAERALPASIPRPRLRTVHDWHDARSEYRAELYDRESAQAASASPTLTTTPDLPPAWWSSVRALLHDIAAVPTGRTTVHQPFLDYAMPKYLGTPIDTTAPSWSTAHGDFHWANLCAPELRVFDWEGWGQAPTGYDAAVLHTYALNVPTTAATIRRELDVLNTPTGHHAELVAITQLLHSTTFGNNLDLAPGLQHRAEVLLGRTIPLSTGTSSSPTRCRHACAPRTGRGTDRQSRPPARRDSDEGGELSTTGRRVVFALHRTGHDATWGSPNQSESGVDRFSDAASNDRRGRQL
jgi:hypothetical protein